METNLVTYFSIIAKDKAGELARVSARLMNAEVDCEGIWGFSIGMGTADILVIPRDVKHFKEVAEEANWNFSESSCFRIRGQDKTGALVDLLDEFAQAGFNLHAVDAMAMGKDFSCYIWAKDQDIVPIAQLLGLRSPLL